MSILREWACCKGNVGGQTMGIQCSLQGCGKWFHDQCLFGFYGYTTTQIKNIVQPNFKWSCPFHTAVFSFDLSNLVSSSGSTPAKVKPKLEIHSKTPNSNTKRQPQKPSKQKQREGKPKKQLPTYYIISDDDDEEVKQRPKTAQKPKSTQKSTQKPKSTHKSKKSPKHHSKPTPSQNKSEASPHKKRKRIRKQEKQNGQPNKNPRKYSNSLRPKVKKMKFSECKRPEGKIVINLIDDCENESYVSNSSSSRDVKKRKKKSGKEEAREEDARQSKPKEKKKKKKGRKKVIKTIYIEQDLPDPLDYLKKRKDDINESDGCTAILPDVIMSRIRKERDRKKNEHLLGTKYEESIPRDIDDDDAFAEQMRIATELSLLEFNKEHANDPENVIHIETDLDRTSSSSSSCLVVPSNNGSVKETSTRSDSSSSSSSSTQLTNSHKREREQSPLNEDKSKKTKLNVTTRSEVAPSSGERPSYLEIPEDDMNTTKQNESGSSSDDNGSGEDEQAFIVEHILAKKLDWVEGDPPGMKHRTKYLVKWKDFTPSECTWEYKDNFEDKRMIRDFEKAFRNDLDDIV